MRKTFTAAFKTKVVLDSLAGDKTINELAALHGVHPTQISEWKKQVTESIPTLFSDKRTKDGKTHERDIEELHRTIGKREVELAWLKKKLCLPDDA